MDWTPRTVIRAFLLLGGIYFIGTGGLEGDLLWIGIGVVAVGLGAFGLWWEYTHQPDT